MNTAYINNADNDNNDILSLSSKHLFPELKEAYLKEENVMKKARLLKTIRETTEINYFNLSYLLHESERNLYRVHSLNNLIPEFQELVEKGVIRRVKAYNLSTLSKEQQYEFYRVYSEKLIELKQQEFVKFFMQLKREGKL